VAREIVWSSQFKRDYKRAKRQGADISQLEDVIKLLVSNQALATRYRDHPLVGNRKGYRECHIQPDWLLIYRIEGNELQLIETGSHADLFG